MTGPRPAGRTIGSDDRAATVESRAGQRGTDHAWPMTQVQIGWRQPFSNGDTNRLHAEAFDTRLFDDDEWDWVRLVERHSLGWVTARRDGGDLIGFANVISDGFVHAWLQDVMVRPADQGQGIGTLLIERATEESRRAGCEWLHVDFDDDVADFYYRRCGFQPTNGGLLALTGEPSDRSDPSPQD